MAARPRDRWAEWLANRRFGGDPEYAERVLGELGAVRDKVLDNARLAEGETLLDVGCGEGLIAFGALERGAGSVVFTDISDDVLEVCRRLAGELNALERCRFANASADDLSAIPDASVDVVTTRSVLIYVKSKEQAFSEFHRVLRPGGRISLFEPINRFGAYREGEVRFWLYDLRPLPEIAAKLNAVYDAIQPPGEDPMLDFDERDLIALAERAGFFPVELDLRAEVKPSDPQRWETFLQLSGNPNIPTFAEAMDQALTPAERRRLTAVLKPLVEDGRGTWRMASAYLWATKPST